MVVGSICRNLSSSSVNFYFRQGLLSCKWGLNSPQPSYLTFLKLQAWNTISTLLGFFYYFWRECLPLAGAWGSSPPKAGTSLLGKPALLGQAKWSGSDLVASILVTSTGRISRYPELQFPYLQSSSAWCSWTGPIISGQCNVLRKIMVSRHPEDL